MDITLQKLNFRRIATVSRCGSRADGNGRYERRESSNENSYSIGAPKKSRTNA